MMLLLNSYQYFNFHFISIKYMIVFLDFDAHTFFIIKIKYFFKKYLIGTIKKISDIWFF
jgi:hypothetical protein